MCHHQFRVVSAYRGAVSVIGYLRILGAENVRHRMAKLMQNSNRVRPQIVVIKRCARVDVERDDRRPATEPTRGRRIDLTRDNLPL